MVIGKEHMHNKDATLKRLPREGNCVAVALLLPMTKRSVVKAFLICPRSKPMEIITARP